MADTQHTQQNQGTDLAIDDDVIKPVDVDIENGVVAEVDTPPAPQKKHADDTPPARILPRPQARIQALVTERDQWQSAADRLQQELAEARQQAAQEKTAREAAERHGMENLVQRTKTEVVAAKQALLAAKEAGDASAEIEAHARLSRAAAEEADADAWVSANPKQEPGPRQQEQPQPQQRQQQQEIQPLTGPVRDFIAENAWFSNVEYGNDGRPLVDRASGRMVSNAAYDPEMHNMAMIEDQKIQREIKTGKLPKDYLGTPDYFERVKNRVLNEFPDAFEGEEEETPPAARGKAPAMAAPKQGAAPSSRQVPGQTQQKQGSKMRLDGEQAALVRSLVDNGTLTYSHKHPDANKRGQKMSYDDAYVQYAKQVQTDQANRG